MSRFIVKLVSFVIAALLVGCASAPYMPLAADSPQPEATKPLYLMSVVVRNDYKQRWQPRVLNVILNKDNGTPKPDTQVFRMDAKGMLAATQDGGSETFLVRFTAGGASNTLIGMNAMASAFPIHGFYFVPMHAAVPDNGPGVYYLGSVKAVIRERKDNEFRAGPVIPLIDQSFAGASSGTFDIEIGDAYATDVELFKTAFPALKDTTITKATLAPWDRAKAQLAWEKN